VQGDDTSIAAVLLTLWSAMLPLFWAPSSGVSGDLEAMAGNVSGERLEPFHFSYAEHREDACEPCDFGSMQFSGA
jgi:hypothetical protein